MSLTFLHLVLGYNPSHLHHYGVRTKVKTKNREKIEKISKKLVFSKIEFAAK